MCQKINQNITKIKNIFKKYNLLDNNYFIIIIFFILAIIIYNKIFQFSFFQDDFAWLSYAKNVLSNNRHIFTTEISNFIMPIIYFYFIITFKLFGLKISLYYLTNIFLHAINSFLLYLILKKIISKKNALISSLVFLSLRYLMESIVWISAVTLLLSTFFLLLIGLFWLYFLETKKRKYYYLVILFTFLIILTKEWSVLTIPFILLIHILFKFKKREKIIETKYIKKMLPIFLIFIIYLSLEFILQNNSNSLIKNSYYQISYHAILNIIGNFSLTFLPLTNVASLKPKFWLYFSSLFLGFSFILSWYFYKRKKILIGLGILWILIAYLPTSFFTWNPYISRYSYIPSIGLAIIVGLFLEYVNKQKKIYNNLIYFLVIFYVITNIFFINKVINNFYKPIHQENKKFSIALNLIKNNINYNKKIYIYYKSPHKASLLPDILNVLISVPKKQVIVVNSIEECKKLRQCLYWNPKKKNIKIFNLFTK